MEERGINVDNGEPAPVTETLEEIERRHKAEMRKLEGETRALMKTAKKSTKAQIETQIIQMQYDMKARHQEEMDAWEASGGDANVVQNVCATVRDEPEQTEVAPSEEEIAALKKAKAKKKQVNEVFFMSG
jgi:poly-D-alanine transfer protein DltD